MQNLLQYCLQCNSPAHPHPTHLHHPHPTHLHHTHTLPISTTHTHPTHLHHTHTHPPPPHTHPTHLHHTHTIPTSTTHTPYPPSPHTLPTSTTHPTHLHHTYTQMEVDEADEISEQVIYDEVHPQKTIVKTKFLKPKPPGRSRSPAGNNVQK